ncbi:MAG: PA14 domain-containing protein, partial [Victivallaceae bacterium]
YDAAGNASRTSAPLTVPPIPRSENAAYYAWLASWFGTQAMLTTDDPDGDGIDNYHEYLAGSDPTRAPGPVLRGGPRGFTTLTLFWDNQGSGVTYEVRRTAGGVETVGQTSTTSFTDRELTPGSAYSYSIRVTAADGTASDWSQPLEFSTQANDAYLTENGLSQSIDSTLPASGIQNGEALVAAFGNLSDEARASLTAFIDNELAAIRAAENSGIESDANERAYLRAFMVDLAEKYWRDYLDDRSHAESRDAALAVYRASLNFAGNDPVATANVLNRMADMHLETITPGSSGSEIAAALATAADIRQEFVATFGGEYKNNPLFNPYRSVLRSYLKYLPRLLAYDTYNAGSFDAATVLAANAVAYYPSPAMSRLQQQIAAWSLGQLAVDLNGAGTVTLRNISDKLGVSPFLYSRDVDDVRNVAVNGNAALPVYTGHLYEVSVTTPVVGGPDWTRNLGNISFGTGKNITVSGNQVTIVDGDNQLTAAAEQPQTPYNLAADIYGDIFNLSWDWLPPEGFTLSHFNVWRGDELIGTATASMLAAVPRSLSADQVYNYYVSAVSPEGVETARSMPLQVLPEFDAEALAYFAWKQQWFGDAATLASDDPDNDGLTNYQEFQLGSNPTLAAPSSADELNLTKVPGIKATYYVGEWFAMPDFATLAPFKQEILNRFNFTGTYGEVLSSERSDKVGAVLSGYFDVAESGAYQFFLSSDDGCHIYIDGALMIANDTMYSKAESLTELNLKAGTHSFRIEYFEYGERAALELYWAGPGFERVRFDQAGLWYLDGDEPAALKEYIASQRDTDGDGLTDFAETRIGTNRNNRDTDGDGLDDAAEVNTLHTDPTNADTNGNGINDADEIELNGNNPLLDLSMLTFAPVAQLSGDSFARSLGTWIGAEEGAARATTRRGALEYDVNLSDGGILRLDVPVRNGADATVESDIDLLVDNVLVGKFNPALSQEAQTITAYTPYLGSGAHVITLYWDNHAGDVSLVVDRIDISAVRSLAEGENATAELVASVLQGRNTVADKTSSRTSPAHIEGNAKYPELAKVNGNEAVQLSGGKWYAEFALSPTAATSAEIAFENGGYSTSASLEWSVTNIISEDGETIKIRKGDSLLLSAATDQPGNSGTCTIECMGETYTGKPKDAPIQVQFNEAGTFEITGNYMPAGNGNGKQPESGTVTVQVVEYLFGRDDVVCLTGSSREWEIPTVPEGVVLGFDNRLRSASVIPEDTCALARVYIDDNRTRYLTARVADDGALLAQQKLSGVGCYSNSATYVRRLEVYEDGSQLVETLIVLSSPRPDLTVELDIFVPGVLFETGEISRVLTKDDFGTLGMIAVRFVRGAEVKTSICHTLRLYQSGEYVGARIK